MKPITTTVAAACAAFALTAGTALAQTVPPDRRTNVTFSGPVSVPGMTLPAGTYTIRILDSNANRHVVQIWNQDATELKTTLLAVPATRLEPTGDPIITFKESPSNMPPAVHYWYYAGDLAGNELVYPKNQAQLIANASGEAVMSVDSDGSSIDDWKSGSISRVEPSNTNAANTANGQDQMSPAAASTASTTTAADTTAQSQAAQPSTTPETTPSTTADEPAQPSPAPMTAQQPSTADQTAQPSNPEPATAAPAQPSANETVGTSGRTESLPRTASELPMVALLGFLALGGALAIRVARTA
jgi:hypothetical protein